MIKVILKGALGNQMFQYAHGKALSLKYNVPLILDLSFLRARVPLKKLTPYKHATYRDYWLDIFDISDKQTSFFNNSIIDTFFAYPLLHITNKLGNKNYVLEGKDPYFFDENIAKMGPNLLLNGFWNNYKYFLEFNSIITKIFDTDKLFDNQFLDYENYIKSKNNSVAVHIRRGDYINSKNRSVYMTLDKYYSKAIAYMNEKLENPYYFIFSETTDIDVDINTKNFEYVNPEFSGYKNRSHFRFMSLCNHNIIANSTFSWWAAYLNKNTDKLVITPKKWHYQYNFENIPEWISVEN